LTAALTDNNKESQTLIKSAESNSSIEPEGSGIIPKDPKEDTTRASAAWEVIREIKYTNRLQREVDQYNIHYFTNFKLRLVMDPERG